MTILLMLIPIALVLGLAALGGFIWAMRSGQFEDLDGAAQRILFDDAPAAQLPRGRWVPGPPKKLSDTDLDQYAS